MVNRMVAAALKAHSAGMAEISVVLSISDLQAILDALGASKDALESPPTLPLDVAPMGGEHVVSVEMPTKGGPHYLVTRMEVQKYRNTYPDLNVDQEFRSMHAWLVANPTRHKTGRGMPRFIAGWMERARQRARETSGARRSSDNDYFAINTDSIWAAQPESEGMDGREMD